MIIPGKITAINSNVKKTEVKFELSSEVKYPDIIELQKLIGQRVIANFKPAQMDIDDLEDDDYDGLEYNVDPSGNVDFPEQTNIEEFIDQEDTAIHSVNIFENNESEEHKEDITSELSRNNEESLYDIEL